MRTLRHWRAWRAFRRLPANDRQIVFYAESGQDWHHFAPVIEELTGRLARKICYVSSDPADPGLAGDRPLVLPFCIGSGFVRTVFFQFVQADVVVLQLLDLHNLQLKRSVHPVHYVHLFHSLVSTHMADRADSYDHYDTIMCAGPHHVREIRKRESMHGLPEKRLVEHGYHRIEHLLGQRSRNRRRAEGDRIHVLLAPSWGEHTILNLFGERLVELLLQAGMRVTLRPHFQTRWMTPAVLDAIIARFRDHEGFEVVEYLGEDQSLFDADVMITDWSGAGMDFALGLEKPVLYIDVPPKSRNDTWQELDIEPFESYVRDKVGALLPSDKLQDAPRHIEELLRDPGQFVDRIEQLRGQWVFNLDDSAAVGAEHIAEIADGRARPPARSVITA